MFAVLFSSSNSSALAVSSCQFSSTSRCKIPSTSTSTVSHSRSPHCGLGAVLRLRVLFSLVHHLHHLLYMREPQCVLLGEGVTIWGLRPTQDSPIEGRHQFLLSSKVVIFKLPFNLKFYCFYLRGLSVSTHFIRFRFNYF